MNNNRVVTGESAVNVNVYLLQVLLACRVPASGSQHISLTCRMFALLPRVGGYNFKDCTSDMKLQSVS